MGKGWPSTMADDGSARLEGYKGSLKVTTAKKAGASRTGMKPKAAAKR